MEEKEIKEEKIGKLKKYFICLKKGWLIVLIFVIIGLLTGFKWGNDNDLVYNSQWCGLYWFNQIFFGTSSSMFWRAFRNTFVNSMYGLIIGFPIPIILALLFSEIKTGWYRSVVQVCAYLPHFVSLTVVTTIISLWCEGTIAAGGGTAAGGWVYNMCKTFGWLNVTNEAGEVTVLQESILSYPNTLPQPLQESYSADYKPAMIRTTFTDGSARQRTMPYNASDFSVSCVLMLTGAQWVDFWNFYKSLGYGADWFTMNLPLDNSDSVNTRTVRIKNGQIKKDLQFRNTSNFVYKVSFTLDVRE